jgi:hypothetical protein
VLNLGAGDRIAFNETSPRSFTFQPVQKLTVTALKGMFGACKNTVSISDMKAVIAKGGAAYR